MKSMENKAFLSICWNKEILVLIVMFSRKKGTLNEVYYCQLPRKDMRKKLHPMTKDSQDLFES